MNCKWCEDEMFRNPLEQEPTEYTDAGYCSESCQEAEVEGYCRIGRFNKKQYYCDVHDCAFKYPDHYAPQVCPEFTYIG